MERKGQVMIGVWVEPFVKKHLRIEAAKEDASSSDILRDLILEWLAQRKVKLPKKQMKEGEGNAATA